MNYSVWVLRRAQKAISRLSGDAYGQVRSSILALGDDPRPPGCRKLTGRDGWRVRVGTLRIVYEIDDRSRKVTGGTSTGAENRVQRSTA